MSAFILRRLWQMIPTMLGVVLLVFFLFNFVGGDPAYLLAGKISNKEQIENIRTQLGINQPYYIQLWIFIKQILTGDFGVSWATNEPVSHIIATRIGPSLTVLVPILISSAGSRCRAGVIVLPRICSSIRRYRFCWVWLSVLRPIPGFTGLSSSMKSIRTTFALHVPKACPNTRSC